MKIVLIGSGHVATALGKRMGPAGHEILQVFSRNPGHARALAESLQTGATGQWSAIDRGADLYLVAISDDALEGIGDFLHLDSRMVVHTAGSVSREVLRPVSRNYGVLYPLQTFRKECQVTGAIPFLTDANTAENRRVINDFAHSLSDIVEEAGDAKRLKLHLAAVFVNNFTNHLFALAADYCRKEQIGFQLLLPLIRETVERLSQVDPARAQTGPAQRNDQRTMARHLALLDAYPGMQDLYQRLTKSIEEFRDSKPPFPNSGI